MWLLSAVESCGVSIRRLPTLHPCGGRGLCRGAVTTSHIFSNMRSSAAGLGVLFMRCGFMWPTFSTPQIKAESGFKGVHIERSRSSYQLRRVEINCSITVEFSSCPRLHSKRLSNIF